MRSIKIGLALMAALVFSVAMTASSASAALSFLATKLEKLLAEKVEPQLFKTDNGTVECTALKIEGGTSNDNGEQSTQLALIEYENCKAFGFVVAKLSLADFLFEASGKVKQDNEITITLSGSGCVTKVPAQTVSSVAYDNSGKNILLLPSVKGIEYEATSCTINGKKTDGEYSGSSEVMVANGTLSFMP